MATWLDVIHEESGWTLVDTGRLETLIQSLSRPSTQFPSLIYFVGNGNRIKALRALFPRNNVTRRGPATLTRLHISTETANTQHPVFFAESGLFDDCNFGESMLNLKPTQVFHRYSIPQGESCSSWSARRHVMSRMILPWTHVLCLFADTLSEIQDVYQLLEYPRLTMKIGSQFVSESVKIIIVFNNPQNLDTVEMVRANADHNSKNMKTGVDTRDITFVDLSGRHELSPAVAFEPLRQTILDKLYIVQTEKANQGVSFSAVHMGALWAKTLELDKRSSAIIDFLQTTRESLQSRSVNDQHLSEFLSQAYEQGFRADDVHRFIASALLMHAYPPGMHMFHPITIFNELYRKTCENAQNSQVQANLNYFCDAISHYFNRYFSSMNPARPSSTIRRSILRSCFRQCRGLFSTTTCFLCLTQPPELILPCHHGICDTCAVVFGDRNKKAEYHFDISQCPLCLENFQFTTRLLPPTKRAVLLSLDGGGIRGIIQLGILRALEKRLGKQAPLSHTVDLSVGTSVGALNIMDIIFNKSSAEKSFHRFPDFARKIFNHPKTTSSNKCIQWVRGFIGFLKDAQYDERTLETTLKEVLGPHRRLFDSTTTHDDRSRVAVIASRTSDGKACVLANYRGVGRQAGESAYEFLEPQNDSQNPFLWEVARCSVAAPWFFQVKSLTGFGPLQDGGVRANNPLSIAMKECGVIWPRKDRHDLLISVGTGFTPPYTKSKKIPKLQFDEILIKEDHERRNRPLRGVLREGAIPRLIRATMSSPALDGEQAFLEALNYLPNHMQADIYRLNHALAEPLPRLDEVGKLVELSEVLFSVPDELVRSILVTGLFFFELDQTPTIIPGGFKCEGSVLCSSPVARDVAKRVLDEFPSAVFRVSCGFSLGSIDGDDGCELCGYYRKRVSFVVNSLETNFTIQVANARFEQRLGGFPTSVRDILYDQQAYAHFGRVDHLLSAWPPKRQCFCSRGSKRCIEFLEPPLDNKKRRL